jgi:hypothetical protein
VNNRAKFALGALVAAASAVGLVGCPPCGSSVQVVAAMHFESDCASELCGMTVVTGHAARDAAFTPGEHVLNVAAGTTLHLGLSTALRGTSEQFAAIVRCDPGATITVTETVTQLAGPQDGGLGGPTQSVTRSMELRPQGDWAQASQSFPARFSGTVPRTNTGLTGTATDLSITVAGAACSLDDIAYSELIATVGCD